ncbi:MAG TPA: histidine kinase [Flavisolibacter sp.]|nr:histidine kinase [Flavisolibacter sp.]
MGSKFTIPKFTNKDFQVLIGSMLPMTLILNYYLFKGAYFRSFGLFVSTTAVTFIFLAIAFLLYGFVAIALRNRLPFASQSIKRLSICIGLFIFMSAVYVTMIVRGYDAIHFYGYEYTETDFLKSYLSFIVINIFLTFLNEGIYRFEKYKENYEETTQLKKEYMHSQLLGLKSQMNPHFLFNCLNTLSCLINEDSNDAEDFLDHMSKVYRYLLRNNEEQLVTLETELNFIRSYTFLLKSRYAEALDILVDVNMEDRSRFIPPLTLQMIIENAMNQNTISKDRPLHIYISANSGYILVRNNVQTKMHTIEENDAAMENIANKFRLLCQQEVLMEETETERKISFPLITHETSAA